MRAQEDKLLTLRTSGLCIEMGYEVQVPREDTKQADTIGFHTKQVDTYVAGGMPPIQGPGTTTTAQPVAMKRLQENVGPEESSDTDRAGREERQRPPRSHRRQ